MSNRSPPFFRGPDLHPKQLLGSLSIASKKMSKTELLNCWLLASLDSLFFTHQRILQSATCHIYRDQSSCYCSHKSCPYLQLHHLHLDPFNHPPCSPLVALPFDIIARVTTENHSLYSICKILWSFMSSPCCLLSPSSACPLLSLVLAILVLCQCVKFLSTSGPLHLCFLLSIPLSLLGKSLIFKSVFKCILIREHSWV